MTTALVRYEAARNALQAAASVDEVKDIRDKAQAMAAYARQAKDTELQAWAAEIKLRAERKAGELLKEMEHSGERLTKDSGRPEKVSSPMTHISQPKTLADLGIARNDSSKWQKLAEIPEETFERKIVELKQNPERVTTTGIVREIVAEQKRAQSPAADERGPSPEAAKPRKAADAEERLREKQFGRHPDAHAERADVESDIDEISEEEIERDRQIAEANAERVAILLESDDALAELSEKNRELNLLNTELQIRIKKLIDEHAAAIRGSKSKDWIIKKLEKENAELKAQLLAANEPEDFEF
jgi:hypothetical protein